MNRKSVMGALHPVFFLLTVYVISIVLAFFVCNTIYDCLHGNTVITGKSASKVETLTALK